MVVSSRSAVRSRPGFAETWGTWSFRRRCLLAACLLAGAFAAALAINLSSDRKAVEATLQERSALLRAGVEATVSLKKEEALHAAAFVASDPEVRRLMRLAYAALINGSMKPADPAMATVRAQLLALQTSARLYVSPDDLPNWQFEFHLVPQDVNFLRLAAPERFGDSLTDARPMVAVTHRYRIGHSGFEVGRMYAGLRGLYPVYANPEQAIGSVEVGLPAHELLRAMQDRFDARFILAIGEEEVLRALWPEVIGRELNAGTDCGCYYQTAEGAAGLELASAFPQWRDVPADDYRLVELDGHWYSVTRSPMASFGDLLQGLSEPDASAQLLAFSDQTSLLRALRREFGETVLAFLGAFIVVLGLVSFALKRYGVAEEELALVKRLRGVLFDLSPDAVSITDRSGVILEANERFIVATGYDPDEIVGRKTSILKSGQTPEAVYRDLWQTVLEGREWRGELLNRRKDGSLYWDSHAIVPVMDSRKRVRYFISFQRDITAEKAKEAELRRAATTDALTGLANRGYFFERAREELERVARYRNEAAIIVLDVDHFKQINDTWGHAAGDQVLRSLAGSLCATLRSIDLAGRIGGEEFAVLLPGTSLDAACITAERLRRAFESVAHEFEDGQTRHCSASFGVTALRAGESPEETLARADGALYEAKEAGRNQVRRAD